MRNALWLVGAGLLAGCADGGGEDEAPYGLEQRVVVQGLTFPTGLPAPGPIDAVDAFPFLTFAEPVALTHAGDGSDRLFVAERNGRVRVVPNDPTVTTKGTFLDIRSKVMTGGERGLLGLAFDPDYASNGRVYVRYSTPTSTPGQDHRDVLARYTVSASDPDALDPQSEQVLLAFDQPFSNHNGGAIAFGPDGMLYVAIGDGGDQHDPFEQAQDLTRLFGKVLRLTPDGGVPPDNPFVGQGGGVREEIWARGFRNPWRFSFDRGTGELWLGDVGQGDLEEIDLVVAGGNYGWDLFEGTLEHENPAGVPLSATVPPVRQYDHSIGRAVTGGYVYRGTKAPSLAGTYVYGDFVTSRVWALVWDGQQAISNVAIATVSNPTSFGEDEQGELYVCSQGGRIRRLEDAAGGSGQQDFPQLLSETGLFEDTEQLDSTPGVIEYDVRAPLWSDGARKRRWMALPGWGRIGFHPTEAWTFPVGTVLVKHFEIDTAPDVTRRLETRVLLHTVAGWEGYTYKWNPDGSDADLLPGADSEVLTILDPDAPGGQVSLTWTFPSRSDCLVCHTQAAGRVLGVRARQLNRSFPYALVVDNQLRAWNHIGLFLWDIGSHEAYGALPRLGDPGAPVSGQARAYLDANCAFCHRFGGPTPVDLDLRYGLPAAHMNAIGVPPSAGDLGLVNALIVAPGSKESSVLWERMRRLDADRMPPLGSALMHAEAVDVVGQWIDDGAP